MLNVNPNFILGVFSNIKLFFFLISSFFFSDEKIKNMFLIYNIYLNILYL